MTNMRNFCTSQPPKDCRFIAIYADSSGAALFRRTEEGDYIDAEGEDIHPYDHHWFADAGVLHYILLPYDFKLWFERE